MNDENMDKICLCILCIAFGILSIMYFPLYQLASGITAGISFIFAYSCWIKCI